MGFSISHDLRGKSKRVLVLYFTISNLLIFMEKALSMFALTQHPQHIGAAPDPTAVSALRSSAGRTR